MYGYLEALHQESENANPDVGKWSKFACEIHQKTQIQNRDVVFREKLHQKSINQNPDVVKVLKTYIRNCKMQILMYL